VNNLEKILTIQNVPAGCMIVSAIALLGAISQPQMSFLLPASALAFICGLITFGINTWIRKYNADTRVEAEKLKLERERERTAREVRKISGQLDLENIKTSRENVRKQRSEIARNRVITDNFLKGIRGK